MLDHGRPVYLLNDGSVLCECCIAGVIDPAAARHDIVKRNDARHCLGCDYHADPACGPGHWCAESSGTDDDTCGPEVRDWRLSGSDMLREAGIDPLQDRADELNTLWSAEDHADAGE